MIRELIDAIERDREGLDLRDLIGKCGYYCGSCPTYISGGCAGCRVAQKPGDCFTFDCVDREGLEYCGQCAKFPCDELLTRERATVLDKRWLEWKRSQRGDAGPNLLEL